MKKITAIFLAISMLFAFTAVDAENSSVNISALVSAVHDDGKADSLSSTGGTGYIAFGSAGYRRQFINVYDINSIVIPDGYVLDKAVLSIYCITNYEITPTVIGLYELGEFDFSTQTLTNENMPARGTLISTFDMPARVNGASYNAYMTFDISNYVKQCMAENKEYIAVSAFQTANTGKGGMTISTVYGDYPPMLTLTFREKQLVATGHSVKLLDEEKDALVAGELTYTVNLYNETDNDITVRLILAEAREKYCTSVAVGDAVLAEKGKPCPLVLNVTAENTASTMRMFVVKEVATDNGSIMLPVIHEKYELTATGWR